MFLPFFPLLLYKERIKKIKSYTINNKHEARMYEKGKTRTNSRINKDSNTFMGFLFCLETESKCYMQ